jgi:hypothetical protein
MLFIDGQIFRWEMKKATCPNDKKSFILYIGYEYYVSFDY